MSEPCCPATTRTGQPCAARPLPGSDRCLFHDPAHQHALAGSRSQGGATPRRRTRRYPRTLDYKYLAELLSELFVDALNEPAPLDAPRLRALTGLATVLLKTVGRPKNTYEIYTDRSEPTAEEDCLVRIHPADPPEITQLLATEAEIEAALAIQDSDPSDPPDPSDPSHLAPLPQSPTPDAQPPTPQPAPEHAWEQEAEQGGNRPPTGPEPNQPLSPRVASSHADPAPSLIHEGCLRVDPGFSPGHDRRLDPQPSQQDPEQDPNKPSTGAPATDPFAPLTPVAADPAAPAPDTPPQPAAPHCVRVETPTGTTLSVPGIPILLSCRRIPRPFE